MPIGYNDSIMRYMDMLRKNEITAHMLGHTYALLAPVDTFSKSGRLFKFRSRLAHCARVAEWVLRFAEVEGGDIGVLAISAIFHDVGYHFEGEGHALYSARLFRAYADRFLASGAGNMATLAAGPEALAALKKPADSRPAGSRPAGSRPAGSEPAGSAGSVSAAGSTSINCKAKQENEKENALSAAIRSAVSSKESINKIHDIILTHSDKHLPSRSLPLESNMLMDADILDEAGAIAVLFAVFNETESPAFDYYSAYARIKKQFDEDADMAGKFRTGEGLRHFNEMRRYIGGFIDGLGYELGDI